MEEIDLREMDERHLEAYYRRLALVETLLDERALTRLTGCRSEAGTLRSTE